MPSILTAPPLAEPVSLALTKARLRLVHGDDDAIIGNLIAAARQLVEARTGLALVSQGWSHFHDDWPGREIDLRPTPLIAVDEVKTFGEDDTAAAIDPAHYYVDAASRPARLVLRGSRHWPRPGRIANGIEIVARHGFGPAADDVPADLREAVLQVACHFYETRGPGADEGLPMTVTAILDRHRQVGL